MRAHMSLQEASQCFIASMAPATHFGLAWSWLSGGGHEVTLRGCGTHFFDLALSPVEASDCLGVGVVSADTLATPDDVTEDEDSVSAMDDAGMVCTSPLATDGELGADGATGKAGGGEGKVEGCAADKFLVAAFGSAAGHSMSALHTGASDVTLYGLRHVTYRGFRILSGRELVRCGSRVETQHTLGLAALVAIVSPTVDTRPVLGGKPGVCKVSTSRGGDGARDGEVVGLGP